MNNPKKRWFGFLRNFDIKSNLMALGTKEQLPFREISVTPRIPARFLPAITPRHFTDLCNSIFQIVRICLQSFWFVENSMDHLSSGIELFQQASTLEWLWSLNAERKFRCSRPKKFS